MEKIVVLTNRYQSATLQDGWDEAVREMKLDNAPLEALEALHTMFLIGAVFVATHKRDSERLLEEALEKLDV